MGGWMYEFAATFDVNFLMHVEEKHFSFFPLSWRDFLKADRYRYQQQMTILIFQRAPYLEKYNYI